ncbi:hypothetical protein C8F01DRAFT_611891 [Mycena amicta]|nr:hypothetical protein C8F01DRAFT_611891 [Mycena amicta]
MPRTTRRPLREMPLHKFLPADPNPNVTPQRTGKRAHSPAIFSPAKRRILESEGIFVGGTSPARLRALPIRADSPIKKLDLGPPKNSPTVRSPSASYTPSEPRMTRSARRRASGAPETPHLSSSSSQSEFGDASSRPDSTRIARELTPVDPQSIHYPGFVVHQDPFLTTPSIVESAMSPEKEEHKENVPPRKRASRKSDSKPYPDIKLRTRTSPRTPKTLGRDRSASLTPTGRRPEVVLTRSTRATPKLDTSERRQLRRRLADEVDAL